MWRGEETGECDVEKRQGNVTWRRDREMCRGEETGKSDMEKRQGNVTLKRDKPPSLHFKTIIRLINRYDKRQFTEHCRL